MSLLAKAPADRLAALWKGSGQAPDFTWLRPPEIGTAMVRGRLGGTGAPFNLGEMTITRCAVQLSDGVVGHGHVQGRDKAKALHAALVDALMQGAAAEEVCVAVLLPLAQERTNAKEERAAKAAATKVDFFTMVRGDE